MFHVLMLLSAAVLVFQAVALPGKSEFESKGVVLLDAITFRKIVPNQDRDVVILVVNKAQIGDYGTDSIRTDYNDFATKAQLQGESDHVLFAHMIVNGGENRRVAEQIGISESFKHPEMFVFPANSNQAIRYPKEEPFHLDALARFTSGHTSLQYQAPGTLKEFDDLAQTFLTGDDALKKSIIEKAEEKLEEIQGADKKVSAEYYVKVMNKIVVGGVDYLRKEIKRQLRLLNDGSKMSKAHKRRTEFNLNVLNHFRASMPQNPLTTDQQDAEMEDKVKIPDPLQQEL